VADVFLVGDSCNEGVDLFECRHNVFFLVVSTKNL
jgi:hypothetical protein